MQDAKKIGIFRKLKNFTHKLLKSHKLCIFAEKTSDREWVFGYIMRKTADFRRLTNGDKYGILNAKIQELPVIYAKIYSGSPINLGKSDAIYVYVEVSWLSDDATTWGAAADARDTWIGQNVTNISWDIDVTAVQSSERPGNN